MSKKGSRKIKSVIAIAATIIATTAGVISAISDNLLKQISLVVMYMSIAVVIVVLVIYVINFFEDRQNGKNLTDLTAEMVTQAEKFKSAAGDMLEKTGVLNKSIEALGTENQKIKESIENFERDYQERFCPVRTSSYANNAEEVNSELLKLLKERKINELRIICFGRQGFGGIVSYIVGNHIDVKVQIIVFNPQEHMDICRKDDENKIRENIKTWLEGSDKIEVIVSDIPPMVRAAVAYTNDKNGNSRAVWGSVQSYRFAFEPATKGIFLEKPIHSLISICEDRKTVTRDLYTLVDCFEEEFKRLENHSQVAELYTNKNGLTDVKLKKKSL